MASKRKPRYAKFTSSGAPDKGKLEDERELRELTYRATSPKLAKERKLAKQAASLTRKAKETTRSAKEATSMFKSEAAETAKRIKKQKKAYKEAKESATRERRS